MHGQSEPLPPCIATYLAFTISLSPPPRPVPQERRSSKHLSCSQNARQPTFSQKATLRTLRSSYQPGVDSGSLFKKKKRGTRADSSQTIVPLANLFYPRILSSRAGRTKVERKHSSHLCPPEIVVGSLLRNPLGLTLRRWTCDFLRPHASGRKRRCNQPCATADL